MLPVVWTVTASSMPSFSTDRCLQHRHMVAEQGGIALQAEDQVVAQVQAEKDALLAQASHQSAFPASLSLRLFWKAHRVCKQCSCN